MNKKENGKKNHNKKQKKTPKLSPIVNAMLDEWETAADNDAADVLGSYTGVPLEGEIPEQDADDL